MLLSEGAASPYAPLFGLFGALVVGGILALGLEGVAHTVRGRLTGWGTTRRGLTVVDGLLGAGLIAVVALGSLDGGRDRPADPGGAPVA